MNLADEIEKRVKALDQAPDASAGGILLPWRQRAMAELEAFLVEHALDIVRALRDAPPPQQDR